MNSDHSPNEILGEEEGDDVNAVLAAPEEANSAAETGESRESWLAADDRLAADYVFDPAKSSHQGSGKAIGRRLATAANRLRLPGGANTGAFGAMFVVVAVVAVSLVLGYTTGAAVASPLLAITLFCLLVFAVLLWAARQPANFSGQATEAEERTHGRWRILLVASETPTVEQLHVLRTAVPRAMLEVHAPILRSRGQNLTTDVSEEIELARNRLRTILTRAGSAGIDASGEVGDPIDPVAAIENQLHRHHVDEVVVATNPLSGANPVESDLLRDLRSQLHKPLTHVEIR